MALQKGVSGLDKVLKNLNAQIAKLERRGKKGLRRAGLLIRREGQKQTPVESGNLVNSWYGPEITQTPTKTVAEIGLTAAHAPYVHEMVGANFTGPRPGARVKARRKKGKKGAKAKFLEDPIKDNEKKILSLIGGEVIIK